MIKCIINIQKQDELFFKQIAMTTVDRLSQLLSKLTWLKMYYSNFDIIMDQKFGMRQSFN